jgi:hypothetical protein
MAETPEQPEDTAAGRKMDPELRVMGAILRLLDEAGDAKAKARIVGYIVDRYRAGE